MAKMPTHDIALACVRLRLLKATWPVGVVVEVRTRTVAARSATGIHLQFLTHYRTRRDLRAP